MSKVNFLKSAIVVSVLVFPPMLGSVAFAKRKSPPKAYSFIAEGGKASQGECDGERKLPRLKRLKDFAKFSSYMGSELQTPELKGKSDGEMWKHFFRSKDICNSVLSKTPSSIVDETLKKNKAELPPEDDSEDAEDESGQVSPAEAE
ncbi:MAG: hypothetical protein OM95_09525 [Bdellovibrio sp. ArHS]|uniref:hypothetical protein n=1 Tax=Bdellovibrio sp. ArHS TaxID=1569284 RepID=UPI00058346C6|nr:hypothetical protein [Bdellovibrio sp. ArHS]KHD88368.1 MAG: hypothetical protein OM95_09525 [Bdellovibrio sp. ArHS]